MEDKDAIPQLIDPSIESNETGRNSVSGKKSSLEKNFNEHDLYRLIHEMFILEDIFCEPYEPSEESLKEPFAIPKSPKTRDLIDNAIKNDPILGILIEDPRNIVIDIMSEQTVSPGETIFREGDPAINFYVIETGKFLISAKDEADQILHAGKSFNSKALLCIQKQKSTVTALEPGTLWTVYRLTCNRALADFNFRKWKSYEGILRSVPILSTLTEVEISVLAREMDATEFSEGQVVIHEGDIGEEFFIIKSGDVTVSKDGKEISRLSSGGYFGEQALLDDSPRSTSVIALGKLRCAEITRSYFQKLVGPLKEFPKRN